VCDVRIFIRAGIFEVFNMNKVEFKKLSTILIILSITLTTIPTITVPANAVWGPDGPDTTPVPSSNIPQESQDTGISNNTPYPTSTSSSPVSRFRDLVLVVVVVGVILVAVVVYVLLLRKRKTCV
jgi:hypothetical protein